MEFEGERFGAQVIVSKCLQVLVSGQMGYGGMGHLLQPPPPPRESARWGIRDPDMSRMGVEYVRHTSLEPGLRTEHVWFWGLNPG
jgi:hypothetical protein